MKPATGTASISGTVVTDEANSRPLRRVSVMLSSTASLGAFTRLATTDDAGRFTFKRLPAGSYNAPRAQKASYVAVTYGEKRTGGLGPPIALAEGQQLTMTIKMLRGGVITGTLRDRGGAGLSGVSVQATGIRVVNGVRQPNTSSYVSSVQTDDRGVYRMYGVTPGDYIIAAAPRSMFGGDIRPITEAELQWAQQQVPTSGSRPAANPTAPPRPAQAVTYTQVYYPGTTDPATAALVTVAAGEERTGIDLGVEFVPTARVEGIVVDSAGQPPANVQLNLVSKSDASASMVDPFFFMDMMMASRPLTSDGKFSFVGVRPGEYTIAARAAPRLPGAPAAPSGPPSRGGGPGAAPMTLWGSADVVVNGLDQAGIAITLQQGMTISGRVAFDATTLTRPTDLSRVTIRLSSAPSPTGTTVSINVPSAVVDADGTFKLEGVTPGRYFLNATSPPGGGPVGTNWSVRSAVVNGVDAADVPFEVRPDQPLSDAVITFIDRQAEVSGTILDANGRPTQDFSILLFPIDKAMWSQRSRRLRPPVRAGTDGKFRFANLVPGEYYLAALTDFQPTDYYNAAFLEQVAASGVMKITVGEGEKKVQDLKVAGGS